MKSLSAIITLIFFSAAAFAQPGNLDSTFNADGIVMTDLGSSDGGFGVAVQPDGKIIAVGNAFSTNDDFAVIRYNNNGTLDNSFSNDGKVTTSICSGPDVAYTIVLQTDGKIIVAGRASNGFDDDFAVVRYNTDGSFDNSFNSDGIVTTGIGSGFELVKAVAIAADGKIIAAGPTWNGTNTDFAVVRYNTDGASDNSFSTDGIVTTDFGSHDDEARAMAIQSDGKIVAAGFSFNGTDNDFALARYNTNGTLDNSFSTDGKITIPIGTINETAQAIAIQPDGKIIAAGQTQVGATSDFALVRLNTDGTLDNSFSSDGIATTDIDFFSSETAWGVTLQPDGKIVAAGSTIKNSNFQFALARYNIDGTLDSTFGIDGKVTTTVGSGLCDLFSVAIQPDGKIVALGYADNGNDLDFALARYISGLNVGILNFSSQESSPLIYPNPIHQTETLEYTLKKNESLTITLYDVNGMLIRNFISNEERVAGEHKEILNIGEVTSGNYFLTISNGLQKMSVKIVKQ